LNKIKLAFDVQYKIVILYLLTYFVALALKMLALNPSLIFRQYLMHRVRKVFNTTALDCSDCRGSVVSKTVRLARLRTACTLHFLRHPVHIGQTEYNVCPRATLQRTSTDV